jgi:hypothetical protein
VIILSVSSFEITGKPLPAFPISFSFEMFPRSLTQMMDQSIIQKHVLRFLLTGFSEARVGFLDEFEILPE